MEARPSNQGIFKLIHCDFTTFATRQYLSTFSRQSKDHALLGITKVNFLIFP